ncbi:hypothetical protein R4P70_10135 [Rhodococcus sp. IEGM 1241]|uniref:hypothetical protein n=1 Tax=Rhodococcus sp. IEGM 1241 TaxID=3082228 RepID=UPI00295418DB|nr:hypothetical protein [Rhodococcus sp. IEGM 1241]MDV8011660.1 hypothetical protein [Rhodococcus sp. IEGM 1241]
MAETSGRRVADVDFTRGAVHRKQQWPDKPLKTRGSDASISVPQTLTLMLSSLELQWPHEQMVTNGSGMDAASALIERALRTVTVTGTGRWTYRTSSASRLAALSRLAVHRVGS